MKEVHVLRLHRHLGAGTGCIISGLNGFTLLSDSGWPVRPIALKVY